VAGLIAPPFCRDTFRALDMHDFMQHAAPAKMRWWAIGHFSHGFDGFGTREETDGAGGRSAVLLKRINGI
jgi:hypothetical protein